MQAAGGNPDNEEALGFGDVILAGVLGLILGWPFIWFGLLLGILLGGVFGVILVLYLMLSKRYKREALMVFMPYGPFLHYERIPDPVFTKLDCPHRTQVSIVLAMKADSGWLMGFSRPRIRTFVSKPSSTKWFLRNPYEFETLQVTYTVSQGLKPHYNI